MTQVTVADRGVREKTGLVERLPFKYSHGITASSRFAFFRYGGNSSERKQRPAPARSRVFGIRTVTGPTPVSTSRSGW